ncbi:uncharacterized protein [Nicotiana sylvestris]|uniref:uncharacterized protein n=1 Tax=Nicotiana sylvestris TaxID=4096 RepID=UPI00388C6B88
MSNPQDNPGTPPQPTPSDSSTPSQPSTTSQPRRRRVKMLARKTVATGALSNKLNAKLKASQAQDSENSDDSVKSASEGEGTGSSDSEKAQNPPSEVRSVLVENLDNRFVLVGSVMNMEIPESRRRGGKNKSEKEKKSEGASSDVRGKGKEVVDSSPTSKMVRLAICGAEHENVEESSKKIGVSGSGEAAEGLVNLSSQADEPDSSIEETLADLLKKVGRAIRSQLRQSEEELQKAKAESKKKIMDKNKAKAHQDEHVTVDVEVQTPKPKKTKTSLKKSSSVSKADGPSSLAKRTRSDMKAKQVKITEEED